jgi:hypothetical protein
MSSNATCPSVYDLPKCVIQKTYLRPGPGNTLMPWVLAAVLSVIHAGVLATRITKWDKSQYLSLALAGFSLVFTALAYGSTTLSADSIYVWLPITLAGDVGAVLQGQALIYKDHGSRILGYIKYAHSFTRHTPGSHLENNGESGTELAPFLGDNTGIVYRRLSSL